MFLSRIDYCLVSTELSAYFKSKGFYNRSQENARLLFKTCVRSFRVLRTPTRFHVGTSPLMPRGSQRSSTEKASLILYQDPLDSTNFHMDPIVTCINMYTSTFLTISTGSTKVDECTCINQLLVFPNSFSWAIPNVDLLFSSA